jgi:hypothetical protein
MIRETWRKALLIAAAYLVLVGGIGVLEYISEEAKLHRGTYTDTFSPFFFVHILTFPVSVMFRDWSGYPTFWDDRQFHDVLRSAAPKVALNIVIATCLVFIVASFLLSRKRRSQAGIS